MNFDNIEMLDIPDDSSVTLMSQTESMSESLASQQPKSPKEYPSLQEWLQGQKLTFQFDAGDYKRSSKHTDAFSHAQARYVTSLYKVVEDLANSNVTLDLETDEPIGVVSTARDIGVNADKEYNETKINEAFAKMTDLYSGFYDQVKDQLQDEDANAYLDLMLLLECVQANHFAVSLRQKPELILLWINKYDPKPENEFIDAVMYDTPQPYLHPLFWNTYMGDLLTRGMFEQAVSSLRASKYEQLASDCPELHAIVEDLLTLVSNYTGMALKGQFAEWKYTVCEFRDNFKKLKAGIETTGHVTIATQIHDLLYVMSGLPKTLGAFVTTWYEMFAALSLFQVRDDESVYSDYFELAMAEKGIDSSSDLEEAFSDVLLHKFLRVILAIDRYDPATAAYVSKLFELKGSFASYYGDVATEMLKGPGNVSRRLVSDYLLTRHAFECMEVHALVPVGVGLLLNPVISSSDVNTRSVLDTFLPSYECFTNDDMEWALTICAKLNLTDTTKKLYLKQGEKSLEQGHLYEALNMLVNCYDETSSSEETTTAMKKVHHIVWDLIFQDCLLNSSPVPDELLYNIVTHNIDPAFSVHPVIRQCISPYAVLAEYFHSVGDKEQFAKNLSRLFHLLRFKYLPKKFVPLLLAQFMPFFLDDRFQLPDLIVIIELIDSFELLLREEDDVEELYAYAVENPSEVDYDWRVVTKMHGLAVPANVKELIKQLRENIVAKIGQVYIGR